MALAFLSGYQPAAFDAMLDAVQPFGTSNTPDESTEQEPYCAACGAPVGIFLAHGKDYRHYRGALTATTKPRPYMTDHAPVIAWRPVTDTTVRAAS